jgi:hypothetical protein
LSRSVSHRAPARRGTCLVLAAAWVLALLAAGAGAIDEEAPADPRSIVLLELDCASELGRRVISLFGNGTVRLKDGLRGKEKVSLTELSPEELAGYRRRLAAEDLGETDARAGGPDGEWVERCRLELTAPDGTPRSFQLARYGSLSLALSRVLAVTQELGDRAQAAGAGAHHLPPGYEPRPGDVLERRDGSRFRVVAWTTDRRGVELEGVDQPLVLYVSREDLAGEFVGLVPRQRP